MVASNYITSETDMEGLWNFEIATARFVLIGVRMAEILNHRIYNDATQQVTDTAHTPILEQISEEALQELIAAAKENAVERPWDFIQANVMVFMTRKMRQWDKDLEDIKMDLERQHSIKYSNRLILTSHKNVRSP